MEECKCNICQKETKDIQIICPNCYDQLQAENNQSAKRIKELEDLLRDTIPYLNCLSIQADVEMALDPELKDLVNKELKKVE